MPEVLNDWSTLPYEEEWSNDILPEGVYPFRVANMERTRHSGGKYDGAPKVKLELDVSGPDGPVKVRCQLFFATGLIWKARAFFRSIGQPVEHGKPFSPNWNKVLGQEGTARFDVREYTDKDGNNRKVNDVKEFLEPSEGKADEADEFDF